MLPPVESRGYYQPCEISSKSSGHHRKIYVAGLLAKTSWQECLEYFSQFGWVDSIQEINTSNSKCNILEHFGTPGLASAENFKGETSFTQGTSKKHMLLTVRDVAAYDRILSLKHVLNGKVLFCAPYHTGSQLMRYNRLSNQRRVILRSQDGKGLFLENIQALISHVETIYGFDGNPASSLSQKRFSSFSVLLATREAALNLIEGKTILEPITGTTLTVEAFKTAKKKSSRIIIEAETPHNFKANEQGTGKLSSYTLRREQQHSPNSSDFSQPEKFSNRRKNYEGKISPSNSEPGKPHTIQFGGRSIIQESSSRVRVGSIKSIQDQERHRYFDELNLRSNEQNFLTNFDHSGQNLRFNCLQRIPSSN
jgi:hypothetical protein